ncbi:MAG: FAD-dependent oxidoreductase [Synechococcales cyanobacterium T60_A2020_003]|nr:FAD-dependent oxidoreductase [Synechococcales cyanobacterium T60_A2020_003]
MTHLKLVIVGGVAGGASAAARARRLNEEAEIIVLERDHYVSYANCGLPYHIGGVIEDRQKLLVQTPEKLKQSLNLDVRVGHEVTAIDRDSKTVYVRNLDTGDTYTESYDKLVLSLGASPIRPNLPGIEHPHIYVLRNIPDMDEIMARLGFVA